MVVKCNIKGLGKSNAYSSSNQRLQQNGAIISVEVHDEQFFNVGDDLMISETCG